MSAELLDTSVIARGAGWLSAWVGDEHVMMSAETGTCVSLSETGGRVWELIETPVLLRALLQQLADEYSVDPPTLRADVFSFLHALAEVRALTVQ